MTSSCCRPALGSIRSDAAGDGGIEKHGNPNVLTLDKGTSRLGQGPIAHTTLVEVEMYDGRGAAGDGVYLAGNRSAGLSCRLVYSELRSVAPRKYQG